MTKQFSEQMREQIKELFDGFECNVDAMSMVEEWLASTVITYFKHTASGDTRGLLSFVDSQMRDFATSIMGWSLKSVHGDEVPEGLLEEMNNG